MLETNFCEIDKSLLSRWCMEARATRNPSTDMTSRVPFAKVYTASRFRDASSEVVISKMIYMYKLATAVMSRLIISCAVCIF